MYSYSNYFTGQNHHHQIWTLSSSPLLLLILLWSFSFDVFIICPLNSHIVLGKNIFLYNCFNSSLYLPVQKKPGLFIFIWLSLVYRRIELWQMSIYSSFQKAIQDLRSIFESVVLSVLLPELLSWKQASK